MEVFLDSLYVTHFWYNYSWIQEIGLNLFGNSDDLIDIHYCEDML